jgi:glycerol-3-phosphate dehydrogenase subunit B
VDLVVIGSGLAGTAAALAAAESGKAVVVVTRGSGASHLSSGALDLADDPVAAAGRPERTCLDLPRNFQELLLRNPFHPYHLFRDGNGGASSLLDTIQNSFFKLFPASGQLILEGSFQQNRFAFTSLGTIKATAFVPRACALAGDPCLRRPLVIGLEEFPDFDPGFWPRIAAPLAEKLGAPMAGGQSGWARVGLAPDLSAAQIAQLLEQPGPAERLVAALRAEAQGFPGLTGIVLPPVLPARGRGQLLERVEQAAGVPARELLSPPPSVPGLRLGRHLEDRLAEAKVRLARGSVVGFRAEGKKLRAIAVENSGQQQELEAGQFVLAAGSFAGGGIRKDKSFHEPIFNLPIFCGEHEVKEIYTAKLTHEVIAKPHLLFTCGLKADSSLRPLDWNGVPVFENLRAVGAILQGSDPSRDGTGAGVAIATGWRGGRLAGA